ncbi:hypothetical protein [Candidatus Poriferisodalis sp.]|uniref:hypothetical protein n=1 Tax=Candidatus Poriferisodalis sp. TaxID=3101277 RepID=UPI003B02800D
MAGREQRSASSVHPLATNERSPKIAHIKARTAKLPWRGLDKTNAWLDLRVAALNLDLAGRLGIIA